MPLAIVTDRIEEVPFIGKLRSAGKSHSLILTVPKEICEIIKLNEGDYVQISIKRIRLEKTSGGK